MTIVGDLTKIDASLVVDLGMSINATIVMELGMEHRIVTGKATEEGGLRTGDHNTVTKAMRVQKKGKVANKS